jgi:hypothetical protein
MLVAFISVIGEPIFWKYSRLRARGEFSTVIEAVTSAGDCLSESRLMTQGVKAACKVIRSNAQSRKRWARRLCPDNS